MALGSVLGSAVGSLVGGFAEEAGLTSDFEATGVDVDSAAFEDPTLAAEKERLRLAAEAAGGRVAPTAVAANAAGTTVAGAPVNTGATITAPGAAGAVQLGQAAQVNAPSLFRTGQAGLIGNLEDAAAGRVVSPAELQLRRGSEANIANQRALAATAGPGANAGAVARNLAGNVQREGQVLNE